MPGKNDYVSVKINDRKIHMQKRLILCNLNELYSIFKTKYPNVKIGLSKFAEFRPKYCVLAGSSGTHTVCICIYHENIKLMLKEINMQYLTDDPNLILTDYCDCLKLTICPDATSLCYLRTCLNCPGIEKIKKSLIHSFEQENLDEIKM